MGRKIIDVRAIIANVWQHWNIIWLNAISHGLLFKNFTFERIIFMNWTIQHVRSYRPSPGTCIALDRNTKS